jgi:glycosyltransferase involved in cell wall biosynthesis
MKNVTKLVTVGLPVHRRFDFLANAIQCVALQDYPNIELIVSDNGMNGTRVSEIVRRNYPRSFRFRQNPVTVPIVAHFNQLIHEASGHYYVVLCDDDEISPNYVSELVGILESNPRVSVAIAKQEVVDFSGRVIRTSSGQIPERMTGEEFIHAWCTYQHGFKTWVTFLGRTNEIRDRGGMPQFPRGTHSDDGLVLKLCLGNQIACSQRCTFRSRLHEESSGYSSTWRELAEDTRLFLRFLDSDPTILEFAKTQPDRWAESKKLLIKMTWETYLGRWEGIYQKRLSRSSWFRAAFAMPFIPAYYHAVFRILVGAAKSAALPPIKKFFPGVYKRYRALKCGGMSDRPPVG